jgi:hypothetical protein
MTYYWDPTVARFRDELGRFVAEETVQGYIDASIRSSTTVADSLSEMVSEGLLTPAQFERQMREEMKREYIRNYLLGAGGRGQMGYDDWGSIGGSLSFQYRKLADFVSEIAEGDLSEAQIRARAEMYLNSARQAFEKAKFKAKEAAGYDEMRWVVNPAIENCDGCLEFEAMGWQKIKDQPYGGCRPGTGCTPCLTNCGCLIEYQKSSE